MMLGSVQFSSVAGDKPRSNSLRNCDATTAGAGGSFPVSPHGSQAGWIRAGRTDVNKHAHTLFRYGVQRVLARRAPLWLDDLRRSILQPRSHGCYSLQYRLHRLVPRLVNGYDLRWRHFAPRAHAWHSSWCSLAHRYTITSLHNISNASLSSSLSLTIAPSPTLPTTNSYNHNHEEPSDHTRRGDAISRQQRCFPLHKAERA